MHETIEIYPDKLRVEAKPAGGAGLPKLAKAETVALWHAVNWMENVLHSWRGEGFKDEQDQVLYQAKKERLRTAKQALRKVNMIRKGQGK